MSWMPKSEKLKRKSGIGLKYDSLLYCTGTSRVCISFIDRALENTLHLMNSKNATFRKSLTKADKSSKRACHV